MKQLCTLLLIGITSTYISAQVGYNNAGSRSNGMGDASVTLTDVYSVMNNQGTLAFIEHTAVGLSAQNIFGLEGLNIFNGAAAIKTKSGNFGISANYFGDENYNQLKAGIAYGRKLGENFGAGIQLDYVSTNVNELDQAGAITFEAGIKYSPYKKLQVGARVFNPIRAKLGDAFAEEELPALFNLGLSYVPSDKIILAIEGEQQLDADLRIKSGIEYHIIDALYLRGGYMSNPSILTAGAGIKLKGFYFDFAAQFHQQLGFTPGIGLQYELN
ncbi:MAG: hypothetical protein H7Y00_13415 [Fimbriimonadaceae bacterium]|nr:hypothetical protein [Chitinophagales bacterium]